jgi:hypothetical protein
MTISHLQASKESKLEYPSSKGYGSNPKKLEAICHRITLMLPHHECVDFSEIISFCQLWKS